VEYFDYDVRSVGKENLVTNSITLPAMIGTREAAVELITEARLDDNLRDERVVIYGNGLLTATPSFVDELIGELVKRHVGSVALVGAPSKFMRDLKASGKKRSFDKIFTLKSVEV